MLGLEPDGVDPHLPPDVTRLDLDLDHDRAKEIV
jgi:hypothetical protein